MHFNAVAAPVTEAEVAALLLDGRVREPVSDPSSWTLLVASMHHSEYQMYSAHNEGCAAIKPTLFGVINEVAKVINMRYKLKGLLLTYIFAPVVLSQNVPSSKIDLEFLRNFNYSDSPNAIQFTDLISLFTLCFAPMAVHILAGVPRTVYTVHNIPVWHNWIGVYNPTSILWRYFAIADRRLRYKQWRAVDMAATNACFWTDRGWDGSEEMMEKSRRFCTHAPPRRRTAILSADSAKTIIISLQGAQALYSLVTGVLQYYGIGNSSFDYTIAVDSLFSPLAVLGLLRLYAASWLTNDYLYVENFNNRGTYSWDNSDYGKPTSFLGEDALVKMHLLPPLDSYPQGSYHPQNSWWAIALRIIYLLPLCTCLVACILYLRPIGGQTFSELVSSFSPPVFMLILFYMFFLSVSIFTCSTYFILGRATSTVIPCIDTVLYKIYTCVLAVMVVGLVIVSAIYTRRTACGQYTTYSIESDQAVCNGVAVNTASGVGPFGLVVHAHPEGNASMESLKKQSSNMLILYLDGWCSGTLTNSVGQIKAVNSSLVESWVVSSSVGSWVAPEI
ncbi:hypothetical protein BP6252_08914 [Coleophoma cylindrospora]|uniref:Uncharacterized protein n=1 Tax=Coleophoma cylindrospora TaxID=1849047 RepID=A0A3D8R0N7_9HELO|nr:hypothetical protein BP6252_08914 [Coleophoma cylindrospora]